MLSSANAVYARVLLDTLGIMLRAGTITKDMHDAARHFQAIHHRLLRHGRLHTFSARSVEVLP
jgi:hypothetical protein